MQTLCDHWFYLLFAGTTDSREQQVIPCMPVVSPATHFFPPAPEWAQGSPSLSVTLTIVALGLGGLAFPLLPVLLPLFISDFSFCSLRRENKYRQCQACYQSTHKHCCMQITRTRDKTREGGERAVPFPSPQWGQAQFWRLTGLTSTRFLPFLVSWLATQLQLWIPTERTRPSSPSQWSHSGNLLIIINVLRWSLGPLPSFLDAERALKLSVNSL